MMLSITTGAQSGCCPECLAALPDHWLVDYFRHCPHRRAVSQRLPDGRWQVGRPIPAFWARFMRWRLHRKLRGAARAVGLDAELLDRLMQWNRPKGGYRG